jgi:hypothetical protein
MLAQLFLLAVLVAPIATQAQEASALAAELKQELGVDDAHFAKVLEKMRRELPPEYQKHALWFGMHLSSKLMVMSTADFADGAKMKRITDRNDLYVQLLKKGPADTKDIYESAASLARAFQLTVKAMSERKFNDPDLITALDLPVNPTDVDVARGLGRRMNAYLTLIGLPPEARRE